MSGSPLTVEQRKAFNEKWKTKEGLLLRAQYCDFMARSTPNEAKYWEESARRRRKEAAAK